MNFHRPCGQPELVTGAGGKQKYVYRRYATPWEVLRELTSALPEGQSYLKPGHSIQSLDQIAAAQSDTESARRMQETKGKLFLGFQKERRRA